MTQPYTRPEPTEEELKKIAKFCDSLIRSRNSQRIQATLMALMRENVALSKECNEHRAARGFELIVLEDLPKG